MWCESLLSWTIFRFHAFARSYINQVARYWCQDWTWIARSSTLGVGASHWSCTLLSHIVSRTLRTCYVCHSILTAGWARDTSAGTTHAMSCAPHVEIAPWVAASIGHYSLLNFNAGACFCCQNQLWRYRVCLKSCFARGVVTFLFLNNLKNKCLFSSILNHLLKGYENNIMAKQTLWSCCLMTLFTLKSLNCLLIQYPP